MNLLERINERDKEIRGLKLRLKTKLGPQTEEDISRLIKLMLENTMEWHRDAYDH